MDSVLQAGIVSAPLQVIIDRLATLTVRETSLIFGVDQEAQKLQRTLERIRALVAHLEANPSISSHSITNDAWKMWLKDVEELLFRADNVLDEISFDLLKHKPSDSSQNQVRNVLLSQFKWNVPREINKIRLQLDDMCKEMDTLFMIELTKSGSFGVFNSRHAHCSYSSSLVYDASCVGRDSEKNEVLRMLLDENLGASCNVSVIAIVGMGGIGKTTLAQTVYNNEDVMDTFDLKMWASVSIYFDVVRITKAILESAMGKGCKLLDLDPIQVKLRDLVRGRKFLLVLDDYWSEEFREWDVLSAPFKVGAKGSKIFVTTRSTAVSRILGVARPCCLGSLRDEDCWELMKQRACSTGRENNSQIEEIGRMIARKCRGVPLAAKTLGSMLQFKETLAEWRSVLESEIWDLPWDRSDIFRALSLSYHHLPAHLKACFTYCAIFPRNYEFKMVELVQLWMAQGFIRPRGKILLEDIGSEYFDGLLQRSFFQQSYVNMYGENIYKMHDLIHGMAQSISGHACLHQKDNHLSEGYTFFKNTRHLSFHNESTQSMTLRGFEWYENLRTFRVTSESIGKIEVCYGLFVKLKFLRELNLSYMGLNDLPDTIGCLKCLRYLNLSGNHFMKMPESITNLFGLLILNLEKCIRLFELPSDMKSMINLRHLLLDVKQLNCMPAELGKLVNLVSLSEFIVGRSKGHGIEELRNMRFLKGSICIKNLENVPNVNASKEAMLYMKPFLNTLELEWNGLTLVNNAEEVLAGLQPHENLKELLITNYSGFLLPSWFSNPLCKLSRISLQSCQHCNILAPLGKLQYLKSLIIEDMSNWYVVDSEFSGFPSLEVLKMRDIPNLTTWAALHGFPCLRTLDIMDCPRLTNLPSHLNTIGLHSLNISGCHQLRSLPQSGLPNSLQSLAISDCDIVKGRCRVQEGEDWYKIRSIPRIEIDYVEITWDMRRF